ncbi:MAG: hypothetical protein V3V19_11055 [Cocleimonas sp.]
MRSNEFWDKVNSFDNDGLRVWLVELWFSNIGSHKDDLIKYIFDSIDKTKDLEKQINLLEGSIPLSIIQKISDLESKLEEKDCNNCSGGIHGLCAGNCYCGCPESNSKPKLVDKTIYDACLKTIAKYEQDRKEIHELIDNIEEYNLSDLWIFNRIQDLCK